MRIKILLLPVFSAAVLWSASAASAQVIVHSIPRHGSGYGGGVCAHPGASNFKIYETWVSSSSDARAIFIKNPVTGREESRLNGPYVDGAHDITYDGKRQVFWITLWGGPVVSINPGNGSLVRNLGNPIKYTYGIFYDREIDRLWVASSYNGKIVRVNPDTGQVEETITVSHGMGSGFECPSGLVKIGNNFWVGVAGEYGVRSGISYIIEIDRQGNRTGRPPFRMPSGKYAHDIGGFSLDPNGYLWVKGGKDTAIYQFDIGYQPTTPTPAPSPTPAETPTPIYSLHRIVDSGDYNGDGISDLAVFRPATGLWAVRGVTRFYFGERGDIPTSGDYRGDGTTDPAIYRPRRGLWAIRNLTGVTFGGAGDIPVPGDYNGDGTCDIGVFRGSSGLWAVRGVTRVYFGSALDRPVPGYYSGSRSKDLAVFRPATGLWRVRGLTRAYYGQYGDIPVPADYAGAGRDEIAIYRPGSKFWAVRGVTRTYFGLSGGDIPQPGKYRGADSAGEAVYNPVSGLWGVRDATRVYFGLEGDIPAAAPPPRPGLWRLPLIDSGDYTGNGISEFALFRASAGLWAIRGRYQTYQVYFGQKGDLPVSGDYDGDGKSDIAVYRPSSGLWSVRFVTRFYFGGAAGDLPAPGDYNGDGTCDSAIFNPRTAAWEVRIEVPFASRSAAARLFGPDDGTSGTGDAAPTVGKQSSGTAPFTYSFTFGRPGDIPVPGYYSGRPQKKIATYNPASGFWSVRGLTRFYFGQRGDFPVSLDLAGDGTDRPGIFRPGCRLWAIRGLTRVYFGRHSDCLPAAADYRGDGLAELGVFRPKTGYWEIRDLTRAYFGRAGDTPAVGGASGAAGR